jgi:adenosine deaminase/aminodeoxyfutalosine deaminase
MPGRKPQARSQSQALSEDTRAFIRALPKAELHLHLEGSVDPATLAELSRRSAGAEPFPGNRYQQPEAGLHELSEAEVAQLYHYKDFQGFMMAFKAVTERLRTAEDFELVTYKLMENLRAQNVLHAEVYVSVGVVHWRGQEFAPLFEGMERGRRRGEQDFGISLLWLFDAVRHFGPEAAQRVVDEAARCRQQSDAVIGFGIGGDERRAAPDLFRDVFAQARRSGLRLTCHAGETAGPESVWGAINIGAERIGHGLHAHQDRELLAILAERQIPVEICVSSNLRTQCCAHVSKHPLKAYFDSGVMIALASDDPAMFSTSLENEYAFAAEQFGFTNEQLRELARNSFEASFLPAERKLELLAAIDAI